MARTSAGAALTGRHRQAQLALRAQSLRDFTRLWPLWQGDEQSFRRLVEATLPLVNAHHSTSRSLAAAYYGAFRMAEGVGGTATPRLADPPDRAAVVSSLYVTGQVMTRKAIAAGLSPQAAMQTALTRTSGAVGRHVLHGGRTTLLQSTATDRQTRGWARVTAGSPCGFCATLASRGAVYSETGGGFQAHDHCACSAEPQYEDSQLPPDSQRFRELYNEVASGSDNPINEMRKALAA